MANEMAALLILVVGGVFVLIKLSEVFFAWGSHNTLARIETTLQAKPLESAIGEIPKPMKEAPKNDFAERMKKAKEKKKKEKQAAELAKQQEEIAKKIAELQNE